MKHAFHAYNRAATGSALWIKPALLAAFFTVILRCAAQTPVLWGTTYNGGTDSSGTIFNFITGTGAEAAHHSFDGDTGGAQPYNSLIQAKDGLLYGMTLYGGGQDNGIIFSYDMRTGTYADLHHFGIDTDGYWPYGSLLQASNGLLYGMTSQGGVNLPSKGGGGIIFSYNPGTKAYSALHDFGNGTDGYSPAGSLIQVNDSLLYGLTLEGGAYDTSSSVAGGVIFSYNIVSGVYAVLYSFGSTNTDGQSPDGALILGSDGFLYGLTQAGGAYDTTANPYVGGTIFRYDISTTAETVLHSFARTDSDGSYPTGSLIQAGNGLLYGTTLNGGGDSAGTVFSYNPSNQNFAVIHDFGAGTDGDYPVGGLMQASDSLIYGTASSGGANDVANGGDGMIFSYSIGTSTYTDVFDFDNADGQGPQGALLQVADTTTGLVQVSSNNNIQIFPNPTTGQFTLTVPNSANNYPVEVYNVLGEKVYESILSAEQNTINLGGEAAGIYFVNVRMDDATVTGKVIMAR